MAWKCQQYLLHLPFGGLIPCQFLKRVTNDTVLLRGQVECTDAECALVENEAEHLRLRLKQTMYVAYPHIKDGK